VLFTIKCVLSPLYIHIVLYDLYEIFETQYNVRITIYNICKRISVHFIYFLSLAHNMDKNHLCRIIFPMFLSNLRVESPITKKIENNIDYNIVNTVWWINTASIRCIINIIYLLYLIFCDDQWASVGSGVVMYCKAGNTRALFYRATFLPRKQNLPRVLIHTNTRAFIYGTF